MKLEDLYINCQKCEGTGHFTEYHGSPGRIGQNAFMSSGPCPECHGAGGKLTEEGRVLKNFMDILRSKVHLR